MLEELYNPKTIHELEKNWNQVYCFTFKEGDTWATKHIPIDPNIVKEQLVTNGNFITYKDPNFGWNISFIFSSLMFPDGSIYDANKGFRPYSLDLSEIGTVIDI